MSERTMYVEIRVAWEGGEKAFTGLADALDFIDTELGRGNLQRCFTRETVLREREIHLPEGRKPQMLPTTQQTVRTLHQQAANSDS